MMLLLNWTENGIVHTLTHLNEDHRAGRTACGRYIEFQPSETVVDMVTCLACAVAPPLPVVDDVYAREAVNARWEDVVRRCGHLHRTTVTVPDDRCAFCGYKDTLPEWMAVS